jgi:hypothetical protein
MDMCSQFLYEERCVKPWVELSGDHGDGECEFERDVARVE